MSSPQQPPKDTGGLPPPTPIVTLPPTEPILGTARRASTDPANSKSTTAQTDIPGDAVKSVPSGSPDLAFTPTAPPASPSSAPISPPATTPMVAPVQVPVVVPTKDQTHLAQEVVTLPAPTAVKAGPAPLLNIPEPDASEHRSRSDSSSTVQRPIERVDTAADLAPRTRSRRNSLSDSGVELPRSPRPSGLPLPVRPDYGRAHSAELKSGMASPVIPPGAVETLIASIHRDRSPSRSPAPMIVTELFAGSSRKRFEVYKDILVTRVPYFAKLFAFNAVPTEEELTFEDLDEYGFALFVRWLYGGSLNGPKDFHTMQHYLCLYVLAHRFDVEPLCNNVMDLVRAYYRMHSMTAPAYRIEYIYSYTSVPNHMRNFLITTAAYRCLCEAPIAPGVHVSDSLKALLSKGGDVPVDFSEAVIKLSKNGIVDVRRNSNCTFHEHSDGRFCETATPEPYMME